MSRRGRVVAVLIAGLLVAGLASIALAGVLSSQPLSGRVPGSSSNPLKSLAGDRYRIAVVPSLAAGEAGWASFITYSHRGRIDGGQGGGGGYPTKRWPFFAGSGGPNVPEQSRGDVVNYVLTGPEVAAIGVGKQTIRTFAGSELPLGDRAAVFFRRARARPVALPAPGWQLRAVPVVPLDSAGHVIPTGLPSIPPTPRTRFWQAPTAVGPNNHQPAFYGPKHPLPGACELAQHGLPGLTPEFGHVVNRITRFSGVEGEAFQSCIDTEYYLHEWPLEVSILLDAARPGQTLGGIPGGVPVSGHPDTVNVPLGQFPGALTARRAGSAWLVVQGGASLKQRLRVLEALRIRKLALRS